MFDRVRRPADHCARRRHPGAEADEQDQIAVLDPADGDWLYFAVVNFDTGETAFAKTAAEHEVNRAKMQKWLRENK